MSCLLLHFWEIVRIVTKVHSHNYLLDWRLCSCPHQLQPIPTCHSNSIKALKRWTQLQTNMMKIGRLQPILLHVSIWVHRLHVHHQYHSPSLPAPGHTLPVFIDYVQLNQYWGSYNMDSKQAIGLFPPVVFLGGFLFPLCNGMPFEVPFVVKYKI